MKCLEMLKLGWSKDRHNHNSKPVWKLQDCLLLKTVHWAMAENLFRIVRRSKEGEQSKEELCGLQWKLMTPASSLIL